MPIEVSSSIVTRGNSERLPKGTVTQWRVYALLFAVVLGLAPTAAPSAQAQSFTVLHNFTGLPDGADPDGGVVMDKTGNLYGATQLGTTYECGSSNEGTVWKLSNAGVETVLWNFTGERDGNKPAAGVILDSKGNLYGDTGGEPTGDGTVYELTQQGKLKVLHSFAGPDGSNPSDHLIRDASGNLYGTATCGGSSGQGTVFKLTP